jgi:hypothetical protein
MLGSVMAHEIGHLLLGSHAHAISGIMRGHWSAFSSCQGPRQKPTFHGTTVTAFVYLNGKAGGCP